MVMNLLNELTTIDDNGEPRTMTKREAVLLTVINAAIAGDLRAARQLQQQRIYEPPPEQPKPPSVLDSNDELVVKQLFARVAEMQKGLSNETDDLRGIRCPVAPGLLCLRPALLS